MEDYIKRMIDEFNQLEEKASKLNLFIETNDIFKTLSKEKQDLMRLQLQGMRVYEYALNKRIALEEI